MATPPASEEEPLLLEEGRSDVDDSVRRRIGAAPSAAASAGALGAGAGPFATDTAAAEHSLAPAASGGGGGPPASGGAAWPGGAVGARRDSTSSSVDASCPTPGGCSGGNTAEQDMKLDYCLLAITGASVVVFLFWVAVVVASRWEQIRRHEVVTSVHMRYVDELDFPAITICNLAHQVPLENLWCGTYMSSQNCTSFQPEGMPNCLTFNNDLHTTSRRAARTGLADTLMIALKIRVNDYPKTVKFSGVHINLHPRCSHKKGECPEELASSLMAAPGRPRFFRMKKIQFKFLNGTTESQFEARDSDTGDINFEKLFGPRTDTVVLGFHYATMAETFISEVPHYTFLSLLSEIGGIMGLLFGFGVVTMVTSLLRYAANRGDLYFDLTGRYWSDMLRSSAQLKHE